MVLSVLIPAYNAEAYIERCLNSIKKIATCQLEVIVINDGSTDQTQSIIDSFSNTFDMKVVSQENMGLSKTRNRMIDMATGDYILFCDSDDFVEPEAMGEYLAFMQTNNLDVCLGTGFEFNPISNEKSEIEKKARINKMSTTSVCTGVDYLCKAYQAKLYSAPVQSSLWKREFLEKNNILFKEGVLYEDVDFTFKSLVKAKRVSFFNSKHFNYVLSLDSITRDADGNIKKRDLNSHTLVVGNLLSIMSETSSCSKNLLCSFSKLVFLDYLDTLRENNIDIKSDTNFIIFKRLIKTHGIGLKEKAKFFRKFGLVLV